MIFQSSLGGIDREVNHSSIDIITMICEMMELFNVPFSIIQEDWADIYMSDKQLSNESWNDSLDKGSRVLGVLLMSFLDEAYHEQRSSTHLDHLSLCRISTNLSLMITVRSNHGPVIISYPEQSYLETMCEFIVPVSQ